MDVPADIQNLLRQQLSYIGPLGDAEWEMLIPHLHLRKIKKHQYLAEQGKQGKEVGIVITGTFRQFYTKDGDEKTTFFFFDHEFIGAYISCVTHQPSLITIEALSNAQLLLFNYGELEKLYQQSHTWERFGRLFAERQMIGLENRMVDLLLLKPEERYQQLLQQSNEMLFERIPQHHIANYLGITPVSLSRIRNRIIRK